MRKNLKNLCLTALLSVVSTAAWALSEVGGVYQIGTAADLKAFAELVNGGELYANAVLTADIDKGTDNYRIGTNGDYQGVFDGAGHTITYDMTFTENGAALFRNIGVHSVIQNLKVQGTLKTNGSYAGAIAGWNSGRIRGCYVDVNIVSTKTGDATDGGMVGIAYRGTVLENCLIKVDLDGESTNNCGGVVGWANDKINIVNCLVVSDGSTLDTSNGNSANIARNGGNLNVVNLSTYNSDSYKNRPAGANYNNYVTQQWGNNNATTVVPLADLADGRICYQLNTDQSKINWVQTIGTDPFPVPAAFGSGQVYASGATGCNGQGTGLTYSNEGTVQATAHTFDKYGVCTTCGCFNFDGFDFDVADNAVLLKSADDIYRAEGWNRVGDGFKLNMKMANDITVTAPSGQLIFNNSNWVDGNFNGDGHALTYTISDVTESEASFIPQHTGIFENVILHGSISTSKNHAGSISGYGRQKIVRNVFSDVTINSSCTGDNTSGGLFGITYEAKTVDNCIYAGSVNGVEGTTCIAGFAGWAGNATTYNNCAFLGTLNNAGGDSHALSRNIGNTTINNVYCLNEYTNFDGAIKTNAEDVASGKLAFQLNGSQTGVERFFQVIGTDPEPMPIPKDGGIVYAVAANYTCGGTPVGDEITYSNTASGTFPPHTFEDGFCAVCGTMQDGFMSPVEGWFEIGTPGQLAWWSNYAAENPKSNARLTADIDMTGFNQHYVMVGSAEKLFTGVFDGQGHTISNLTISGGSYVGMFSLVANGAEIKNFVLDATCSISGASYVGIVGGTNGNGKVYFTNLGNEGNVTGTGANVSGILGVDMGGSADIFISNCYVTGAITGDRESATICSWSSGGSKVENCYSTATLKGIYGTNSFTRGNTAVVNCYEISSVGQQDGVNKFAATIVGTGELCYKLNGSQGGVDRFYQKLGEGGDARPKPFAKAGALVFLAPEGYRCDGTPLGDVNYTNTAPAATFPDHQFDADGICTVCGELEKDAEGYMKITSAKQLVAFTKIVNTDLKTASKARMYADVDMNGVTGYYPIGDDGKLYVGEFDGQGHVVSNLVIDSYDKYDYQGLFGRIGDGADIKNLVLDNTCFINAKAFAGVIGGTNGSGTVHITNVGNEGNVTGSAQNICGIIGVDMGGSATMIITNCYVTGAIKGARESATICGWSNGSSVVKNCYSIASLEGNDNTFTRGGAQINNSYEIETVGTQAYVGKVTDEEVANGALAYKLGEPFGQTLGVDAHPNFTGKKVYAIANTYTNLDLSSLNIETAQGDADCILPAKKYGGEYSAYTNVAQADYEFGDWNTSNPNYNVIIGTPEEQDGKAWFTPGYDVTAWNYGQDLPEFGDGKPADVYAVRFFTVNGAIPSTLYMPAPHDDAPCEYYINGVKVWGETDGWYEDEVVRLTDEQKALIKTDGTVNVFAFHVHQNWGGRYADGGLYNAGDPVNAFKSSVEALDATIALAEAQGIDAEVVEFAKGKSNYRGGHSAGLAQLRKARRLAADARTENFAGTAPADGMIAYIYNVGAKMFLAGGNDWGTHASLNHMGAKCVLHANTSGANRYTIQTNLPNGVRGKNDGLGHNGYVDCGDWNTTGANWAWEFQPVGDGTYRIINCENSGENIYLGMTDDDRLQVDTDKSGADNAYNMWIFVTPEEFEALAVDATETAPVDLGHLIHQATFSANDFDGNEKSTANADLNDSKWERNAGSIWGWKSGKVNDCRDYSFEMWNTASVGKVYLKQLVEGLPSGKYTVSMSGYYRDGNFESADEGNVRKLAYLYAGTEDNCVALQNIVEGSGNYPGVGRGGSSGIVIPDGCIDAAKFFQVGTYVNTIDAVVGADGKLEIGVYRDAEDVKGGDWIVTDNWRLYYKGNPVEVTVTDAGYATFVAPGNVKTIPAGIEAFAVQKVTGKSYVNLAPVTAIPAGEAVVLKAAEGTYTINATAFSAELGAKNDLVAATEEVTADGTQYILAKQDGKVGFAQTTPNTKIAAGKGYLVISGAGVKPFYPFDEDDATGISDMSDMTDQSDIIFNLAGQRINKMQKGVNIINGQKVLK